MERGVPVARKLVASVGVLVLFSTMLIGHWPVPDPPEAGASPEPGGIGGVGELPEQRTATSRTERNADGTFTTTVFAEPIHYRGADGAWNKIDNELVDAAADQTYRWHNAANSFDVRFREQLGDDFLRFDPGGGAVTLSLQGAAAAVGKARGPEVGYARALPQVDLDYEVVPTGVKETLTLHQPGAPNRYQFRLNAADGQELHAEESPDGSWAFYQIGRAHV